MLRHYLSLAIRHLVRRPIYGFINITGLALGLATCLLLGWYIRHEWSYDRFHTDADRLYRVWLHEKYEGEEFINTTTPVPLAPALAGAFPEVAQTIRVNTLSAQVQHKDAQFNERLHLVDSNFFEAFNFPLLEGQPHQVLHAGNGIVLTEAMALKYFGASDPVGQSLTIRLGNEDETEEFIVRGVAQNPPTASSIRFDMLIPFSLADQLYSERARQSWFNVFGETYVLLSPNTSADALAAKFPAFVKSILGEKYQEGSYLLHLQPITDIHLNPDLPEGNEPISNP